MTSSNRSLRATCTKKAAPTWFAEAIWTLLLFWPTVAHRGKWAGKKCYPKPYPYHDFFIKYGSL